MRGGEVSSDFRAEALESIRQGREGGSAISSLVLAENWNQRFRDRRQIRGGAGLEAWDLFRSGLEPIQIRTFAGRFGFGEFAPLAL